MTANLVLLAGNNTTEFVNSGDVAIVAIGRDSNNWTSGSVSVLGKRLNQDDSAAFVIATYTAGTDTVDGCVVKTLEAGKNAQMQIAFRGSATDVNLNISVG